MEKRVVAFVDILGFSHAIKNGDEKILRELEEILQWFAQQNSDGKWEVEKTPAGSHGTGTASFSSFSDCLVISFPNSPELTPGIPSPDYMQVSSGVSWAVHTLSMLTIFCLSKGYLLRGAISYGEIYHYRNVIYGKPLIEAVDAEKYLSIYPRIILCDSIIKEFLEQFLTSKNPLLGLNRDVDGLYYINWVEREIAKTLSGESNIQPLLDQVNNTIKCASNLKHSVKWKWMANYLNKYIPEALDYNKTMPNKTGFKFKPINIPVKYFSSNTPI